MICSDTNRKVMIKEIFGFALWSLIKEKFKEIKLVEINS